MSAHQDPTTVPKSALTLLAPSPVPVTVDTHWHLIDAPVIETRTTISVEEL